MCSRMTNQEYDVRYLGWVSRGGDGGLVVMEGHHEQKPVATAEMPKSPVHRVRADDFGYDKQMDDDHNRGCQQDN